MVVAVELLLRCDWLLSVATKLSYGFSAVSFDFTWTTLVCPVSANLVEDLLLMI